MFLIRSYIFEKSSWEKEIKLVFYNQFSCQCSNQVFENIFIASNVFNLIIHFQKELIRKGDQARVLQSVFVPVK